MCSLSFCDSSASHFGVMRRAPPFSPWLAALSDMHIRPRRGCAETKRDSSWCEGTYSLARLKIKTNLLDLSSSIYVRCCVLPGMYLFGFMLAVQRC